MRREISGTYKYSILEITYKTVIFKPKSEMFRTGSGFSQSGRSNLTYCHAVTKTPLFYLPFQHLYLHLDVHKLSDSFIQMKLKILLLQDYDYCYHITSFNLLHKIPYFTGRIPYIDYRIEMVVFYLVVIDLLWMKW